jgi:hypothetical protein
MPAVFVSQSIRPEHEPIYRAIRAAAQAAGASALRADSLAEPGLLVEQIYQHLESADVVVADISHMDPNVMYELGFAHGAQRPVIVISSDLPRVPFDIASVKVIRYGESLADLRSFELEMKRMIVDALVDPDTYARRPTTRSDINRLFISYSHKDREILDRLLVHLRPLEREELIDAWTDTRLEAGSDWKKEVRDALERARAAILLVSADFLASDFIVKNELPPLLENAERKGTTIIPVIVQPCRYTRDSSLRHLQAVNDPNRPLMGLSSVDQERLLDNIAAMVEQAMRPLS